MLNERELQDMQTRLSRLFEDFRFVPIDTEMIKTGEAVDKRSGSKKDVYTATLIVAHDPRIIEGEFKKIEKSPEESPIIASEEAIEGTTDVTVP